LEIIPVVYLIAILPIFLLAISIYSNKDITFTSIFRKLFPHAFRKSSDGENIKVKEKKIKKVDKNMIENDVLHNGITYPSIDYLIDTSVDNQVENNEYVEEKLSIIDKILKGNNIYEFNISKNIMPIYSQVIINLKNDNNIDDVLKLQSKFKEELKIEHFLLLAKNNTITFEFTNKKPSAISFKDVLKKSGHLSRIPVGIDIKKNNVY